MRDVYEYEYITKNLLKNLKLYLLQSDSMKVININIKSQMKL